MGEIRRRYDIREVMGECSAPVWAGKGAEAMGLTGPAKPEDIERVFSEPRSTAARDLPTACNPEAQAAIERLFLDGLL